jgi:hypothetical protein
MDWLEFWDHTIEHLAWPVVATGFLFINRKAIGNRLGSIQNVDIAGVVKAAFSSSKASDELSKAEAASLESHITANSIAKAELTTEPRIAVADANGQEGGAPQNRPAEPAPAPAPEATPRPHLTVIQTAAPAKPVPAKPSIPSTGWNFFLRTARTFQSFESKNTIAVSWQEVKVRLAKFLAPAGHELDPDSISDDWLMSNIVLDPRIDASLQSAIRELYNIPHLMATTRWEPTSSDAADFKNNALRACALLDETLKSIAK